MRVWHTSLIPVLPRQQLISQYRECCSIMKSIAEKGTPNHILVNKVMDYPLAHFAAYTSLILKEMKKRGYKTRADAIERFCSNYEKVTERIISLTIMAEETFLQAIMKICIGTTKDITYSVCITFRKNMIAAASQKMNGRKQLKMLRKGEQIYENFYITAYER